MKHLSLKAVLIIIFGAALLLLSTCDKQPEFAGNVLAKVGDRVITSEDFMRRAEYTIRPDFCAGENYIHRKIVLNSLIAEKLLALESPNSPLLNNPEFTAYMQGRQEQAMRKWLYKTQAMDQVEIDTSELRSALRKSIRTYNLQYLNLPDSQALDGWKHARADGYDFEILARTLTGADTIPTHEMSWFERGDELIHDYVFQNDHKKGALLEPLELEDGSFMIIKVAGWVDRPVVSGLQYEQHYQDVQDRVSQKKADAIYKDYVTNIMAGKSLELNKPIFRAYAKQAADIYLKSPEEKDQLLNSAIWNTEEQIYTESLSGHAEIPGEATIFSVDGEAWSVDRFESELALHPLVFRKRNMSHREFPEQLKYAMADLIRDRQLTNEAYKLGYDEIPNVRQLKNMWQDHYVSRQTRNEYVRSEMLASKDSTQRSEVAVIEMYMNPLIDHLQNKYAEVIRINTDLFESLELTTVPMMVSSRNVPFPLVVPAFPRLTTDNVLDYGERLE